MSPFDPTFDHLPEAIPVFPLTGVLLLPRGRLPLNIFEPRYLAMVQDALGEGRMIGMIQPRRADAPDAAPCLSPLGCAGRITSFAETDDGRFLITLTGVCRFRVREALSPRNGYRRVVPDWTGFAGDLTAETAAIRRGPLLAALKLYFRQQGIDADWDSIKQAGDELLVTSLAMICPFEPAEKQALLECADLPARADMLLALIEMAVHDVPRGDCARH